MALFPAFAQGSNIEEKNSSLPVTTNGSTNKCWLENSSFNEGLCVPSESAKRKLLDDDELKEQEYDYSDSETSRKIHKKKNKHKKKGDYEISFEQTVPILKDEPFSVEHNGYKEYLSVNTIAWPAAPKYKITYKLDIKNKATKKQKFNRYFKILVDTIEENPLKNKKIGENLTGEKVDEYFTGFVQEEELSQKTANYNQHLSQYPCDVQMWLEYVRFQDLVHQFEKTYRKGSIAKAQRVLAERKLAILDKALSHNPKCEVLHRERLSVAVRTFPADELQIFLSHLVDKEKENIIIWQGYIEATQCSMSHCITPVVLNLYTRCLSTLHQLRRATALEKSLMEENILRMLYQCGLFLKQAGLFEQLWALLKMYLDLNLCPNGKGKFNILSGFDEKQLIGLEEIIFTSQLPLHELWLRTEKLRESCHWLPYVGDNICEDPQRIVIAEDVAELIHPITAPENIFKLTATIFSLLKIPLLPCHHTTMQDLGLDYVPWSLDSIEPLLSMFLPSYPIKVVDTNFLRDQKLAVGPQYLKSMPGQEEYLKFVLQVMKNCSECLSGVDKLAVTIWWFRFQRLIIVLDKEKSLKLSVQIKKQMKKDSKELLKIPENQQNILYYLEYGLLEKELGNTETYMNIINLTLQMCSGICFQSDEWILSDAVSTFLCRQQLELILGDNPSPSTKQKGLLILTEFILQKKLVVLSENEIEQAAQEFKKVTTKIVHQGFKTLQPCSNFLPDFQSEIILCNAWFIYLKEGITVFSTFFLDILKALDEKSNEPCLQKEILNEFFIGLLFKFSSLETTGNIFKAIENALYQAIEKFPNNLFLLSLLMKKQSVIQSFGPPWWKVQSLLLKSGRSLSTLFSVIILNQHIANAKGSLLDTITGKWIIYFLTSCKYFIGKKQ